MKDPDRWVLEDFAASVQDISANPAVSGWGQIRNCSSATDATQPSFKLKHSTSVGLGLKQGLLTVVLTTKTRTPLWCCCRRAGSAVGSTARSPYRLSFSGPMRDGRIVLLGQRCWLTTDLVCDSRRLPYPYTPSAPKWSHGRGNFFQILPRHARAVHSLPRRGGQSCFSQACIFFHLIVHLEKTHLKK